MRDLEAVEPDLAEYVFESLSDLRQRISALSGSARTAKYLYKRMQSLVLVSISALRAGHFDLWQESGIGQQLDVTAPDQDSPAKTVIPSPPAPQD